LTEDGTFLFPKQIESAKPRGALASWFDVWAGIRETLKGQGDAQTWYGGRYCSDDIHLEVDTWPFQEESTQGHNRCWRYR